MTFALTKSLPGRVCVAKSVQSKIQVRPVASKPMVARAGNSSFVSLRPPIQPSLKCTRSKLKASSGRQALSISAIAVGDKIPDGTLSYFDSEGNMQTVDIKEMCAGKKVVLFAVPGAFTPTCSLKHLPGFIASADTIKAKGVETIGCIAVNDAFVMDAWGKHVNTEGKVLMLADGSALFTKALGVELDLVDKGLGIRSRRYSMLLDDGVVVALNLEEGGAFTISGSDDILAALPNVVV